jgi:hypothetical protein
MSEQNEGQDWTSTPPVKSDKDYDPTEQLTDEELGER